MYLRTRLLVLLSFLPLCFDVWVCAITCNQRLRGLAVWHVGQGAEGVLPR